MLIVVCEQDRAWNYIGCWSGDAIIGEQILVRGMLLEDCMGLAQPVLIIMAQYEEEQKLSFF